MRRLRRVHELLGRPKEIVAGLLLTAVIVAATGTFSSAPSAHHAPPDAGGGGAFVATPSSTTTTTTAPPTTTTPPTTAPPPTTTAAPAPPTQHAVVRAPSSTKTTTAPPAPPPAPPHSTIPLAAAGVYAGSANASGAAGFARDTGAHVTVVGDYLPGGSWGQIDGSQGLSWLFGPWRSSGYQLELGVPMFDNSGSDTLAAGAAGQYNPYFVTLAETLVAAGEGNAILRLGQEFTGSWNPWKVTDAPDAANYAAYYRQIVTAMRSVAGQALKFIWEGADPQDGSYPGAYTADDSYPGDAYVDYIGTDTYDQSWAGGCGLSFNNTTTAAASLCSWNSTTLPGLNRVAAFATAHGKPVVFPEWGLAIRSDGHGMGDDPTFVQQMDDWILFHNVAFDIYFDFDVAGQVDAITDGQFPAALAAYHAGFG